MTTGKLCLAALLGAMPALASAQPSVSVNVGVNVGADNFDTVAPGDPVESVDVFYDQLSPYGVWVDEPDVGRVFVPDTTDYVPYTRGHWEYTNVGFVWVSAEPFGWATSHYGRWAFSRSFGRWYWLPDTEWGPAWVEWRETGTDFGWAPLAPEVVVRAGWQPPVESWHYCRAEHILDANVVSYYEPRTRVVEIHRQARPVEHYATVSNVKVIVGPPAARLREHRVAVRPVKVEARTIGRWSAGEAHAQVERARERRTTFEVQNQKRIEAKPQIHTAQVKVIETHPQIKAQVTARVQGRPETVPAPHRAEPGRQVPGQVPGQPAHAEPGHPAEPQRNEPNRNAEPNRSAEPQHAPNRPGEPQRSEPKAAPSPQQAQPNRPGEPRNEPNRGADVRHAEPKLPAERNEPTRNAEPQRTPPNRPAEPQRSEPRPPVEPQHAAPRPPAPERAQPQPQRPEPQRAEPQRREPPQRAEPPRGNDRKEPDRKDGKDDRKDSDKH